MGARVNIKAPDGSVHNADDADVPGLLADGYALDDGMDGSPVAPTAEAPPTPVSAPASTRVNVYDKWNRPFNVDPADAPSLLNDGYRLPTEAEDLAAQAEEREAALQAQYGDTASQVRTAAEGVASGATLGITDAVQSFGAGVGTAIGNKLADWNVFGGVAPGRPEDQGSGFSEATAQAGQEIELHREANPVTSMVSQGVGMIAPTLFTGGVAGAEVATVAALTPAAKAAQLGLRVQTALVKKFGDTALGRIGAMAGAGAVEGGLQAAARTVVDDISQGDYEITAERMISGLGDLASNTAQGAAWGGLAGGVVGGGIEGVTAAAGKLGQLATSVKVPKLDDAAGESAYKAYVGRTNNAAIKAARDNGRGGASEVGKTLLKYDATRSALKGNSEGMAAAADAVADDVGAQLGAAVKEADALSGGVMGPKRSEVIKAVDDKVVESLKDNPFAQDILASVQTKLQPFRDMMTRAERPVIARSADGAERMLTRDSISFEELNGLRKQLDKTLKYESAGQPTPTTLVMRDVRNVIEDAWLDAADRVGKSAGNDDFVANILSLKKDYSHLALSRDQALKAVDSQLANRATSPSDYAMGAAAGLLSGDPITGIAVSVGHKFAREHGRGYAALGLNKLSQLANSASSQESAVLNAARGTVKSLSGSGPKAGSTSASAIRRIIATSRELANDNASPAAQQLQQHVADIAEESPELAQAIDAKKRQVAGFIADKAGPEVDDADPFEARPAPMDPVRKASMLRYIEAAQKPEIALQRLGAGKGTREDVETLQALYPRLYQRYIAAVGARLGKVKTLPTITQRQRIAFATGQPMAREQRPENIAFLQGLATPLAEEDDPNAAQPAKKSSRSPDRHYASRTDDMLSRGADDRD